MTNKKQVATGLTVGALAAVAVVAIVRYRHGHKLTQDESEHLEELDDRLAQLETDPEKPETKLLAGVIRRLETKSVVSLTRLRERIAKFRRGDLSDEHAIDAEHCLEELGAQADQEGI